MWDMTLLTNVIVLMSAHREDRTTDGESNWQQHQADAAQHSRQSFFYRKKSCDGIRLASAIHCKQARIAQRLWGPAPK